MLRSKRFYLAAVLLAVLLVCLTLRTCRRAAPPAPAPRETRPAVSSTVTAPAAAASGSGTSAESAPASAETAAATTETAAETATETTSEEPPAPLSGLDPLLPEWKLTQLQEYTATLSAQYGDFVAYLIVPESEMEYPVMQAQDNFYYLDRAPDGRQQKRGSIFLDYRNSRSFTDPHSILFGHNMVNGMFGDIRGFKEESEFLRHRYGFLVLPERVLRIEFFALTIADARDEVYQTALEPETWLSRIRELAKFDTGLQVTAEDRFIALSTCASDFRDARALLVGRLTDY